MKDDLPHDLKRPGYGDHDTPPNDEPTGSDFLWASAPFFIAHERAGDVIDIFWSISDCFFTFLFKPTVHHALDVTAYYRKKIGHIRALASEAPPTSYSRPGSATHDKRVIISSGKNFSRVSTARVRSIADRSSPTPTAQAHRRKRRIATKGAENRMRWVTKPVTATWPFNMAHSVTPTTDPIVPKTPILDTVGAILSQIVATGTPCKNRLNPSVSSGAKRSRPCRGCG